jgi:hypothetical protein
MVLAGWLAQCESTIIYERRLQSQLMYVIPITSILGRLALVPVGTCNGTIPYGMEPFHTPCARRPAAFQEQPAIPSSMVLTEIDGGMSTLLP